MKFTVLISEYDALKRLGISDPKDFIKKHFKNEHMVYLSTCCTGRAMQEQIEASVEEALADGSWVDIMVSTYSITGVITNCSVEDIYSSTKYLF